MFFLFEMIFDCGIVCFVQCVFSFVLKVCFLPSDLYECYVCFACFCRGFM